MIRVLSLEALLLTELAVMQQIVLRGTSPFESIKKALRAQRIGVEHLSGGIDLWRDLEAALSPHPRLNPGAMQVVQVLRNPLTVPVIYGPVVILGRSADTGGPDSLSEWHYRNFYSAFAAGSPQTRSSKSPKR